MSPKTEYPNWGRERTTALTQPCQLHVPKTTTSTNVVDSKGSTPRPLQHNLKTQHQLQLREVHTTRPTWPLHYRKQPSHPMHHHQILPKKHPRHHPKPHAQSGHAASSSSLSGPWSRRSACRIGYGRLRSIARNCLWGRWRGGRRGM